MENTPDETRLLTTPNLLRIRQWLDQAQQFRSHAEALEYAARSLVAVDAGINLETEHWTLDLEHGLVRKDTEHAGLDQPADTPQ